MFWAIVLLLFLGIILILLEVIVPHGISVILGFIGIAFSVYLCFKTFGVGLGVIYLIVATALACGAAFVTFRSGIRWLALAPPGSRSGPAAPARESADPDRPPRGEWLRVVQPLHPTGSVEWQGRRFPARTLRQEQEVPIGTSVRLHDYDSIYLIVDPEASSADVAAS